MDKECTELCNTMNEIPGISTVESCCGHGKKNYHIWFRAKGLRYLPRLLYWFDGCHCGFYRWKCIVETDCGMSPVTFCIEGPIGEQAYKESKEIAPLLIRKEKIGPMMKEWVDLFNPNITNVPINFQEIPDKPDLIKSPFHKTSCLEEKEGRE